MTSIEDCKTPEDKQLFTQIRNNFLKNDSQQILKVFENDSLLTMKSKLLKISESSNVFISSLDLEQIRDTNSMIFKTDLTILSIKQPADIQNFYWTFSRLESLFDKKFMISKMVLSKGNDLNFYAEKLDQKFVLYKGFEEVIFDNWSKFFTAIVELSLVPDLILIELSRFKTFHASRKIEEDLWESLSSLYLDTSSNPVSKNFGGVSRDLKTSDSKKPEDPCFKLENLNDLKQREGPTELENRNIVNKSILDMLITKKKEWKCKKCGTLNSFTNISCTRCQIYNTFLVSSGSKDCKLCELCSQPSLRDKCRQCLSQPNSSSNSSRITNPEKTYTTASETLSNRASVPKDSIEYSVDKSQYSTVQSRPSSESIDQKTSVDYSTVQAKRNQEAQPKKPTSNYNQRARASSLGPGKKNNNNPTNKQSIEKKAENNLVNHDTRGRSTTKDDTNLKVTKCEMCYNYSHTNPCQQCEKKGAWKCERCTLLNLNNKKVCETCYQNRLN